jgi:phosphate transport system substrate-binding protein
MLSTSTQKENEMKKITFVLVSIFATLSILISACAPATPNATAPGDTLSGTITVSGAFALYPLMSVWSDEFHKLHPNVEFDISGGGAGKGMTDALSGAVDIGMVSRKVKPEEESQGAFTIPVVKDAVFGVISASNPVAKEIVAQGIKQETLRKIFITGEIKTWGEVVGKPEVTDAIHVYTRSDSAGAADIWAQFLGGKTQSDIQGVGVNADPGLLDTVVKDPLGIGYNNLGFAFDLATGKQAIGALVIPIDADADGKANETELLDSLAKATAAVSDGTYPSPPGRVENLVTKGKPSGLTQAFIQWILSDGQKLVGQSGYVELTADALADSIAKVK